MALASEKLNIAANGYDVVAYQNENRAALGSTKHDSFYEGQGFLFSSSQNKNEFDRNPKRYLPAYGGYCAMGVVYGKKLPIDPEAFHVEGAVTYLNFNKDVQKNWLRDVAGNIKKGDQAWQNIKAADPSEL